MKKKISLLTILACLIFLTACSKSSTEVEAEYTSYYITVTNTCSADIANLTISMIGLEDIEEISILPFSETTENFEFRLPPASDDNPISFGDYNFSYWQDGVEKYFGIILPETHISVYIDDDGFTVDDMTRLITIMNSSSYDVTDVELSMIGALEFYQINVLIPEESSSEFEFHLVDSSPVPISFGCYDGSYFQSGITKSIFSSSSGSIKIVMHIFDDGIGYSIEE